MEITTLKQAEEAVNASRIFYRYIIQKLSDENGGRSTLSTKIGKSDKYIEMILKRDNFSALRRLAIDLSNEFGENTLDNFFQNRICKYCGVKDKNSYCKIINNWTYKDTFGCNEWKP